MDIVTAIFDNGNEKKLSILVRFSLLLVKSVNVKKT